METYSTCMYNLWITLDSKYKLPTFIFTYKRSRMLRSFTAAELQQLLSLKTNSILNSLMDLKTFIFTVKRSRKLRSFTSPAKYKLPTSIYFYFYMIIDKTESLSTCRIFSKMLFCRQSACRRQHYWTHVISSQFEHVEEASNVYSDTFIISFAPQLIYPPWKLFVTH